MFFSIVSADPEFLAFLRLPWVTQEFRLHVIFALTFQLSLIFIIIILAFLLLFYLQ